MAQAPIENPVAWLILRRMRAPLLALLVACSISVLGLTLVPGVDAAGNPERMSFLHAFYVISYTATTIGFGELPHPFTDAQRLWITFCIYATVIAWVYSIGAILALLGDPALREASAARRFAAQIHALHEPFYIVAGCGETGLELIGALAERRVRTVVIERDADRANTLALEAERLPVYVPHRRADAAVPDNLLRAGIRHRHCRGVIANAGDDRANLAISIAAKLTNPRAEVIARAEHQDVVATMQAFGTNHILDPFAIFTDTLALAWLEPAAYLLQDWLLRTPGMPYQRARMPPRGTWIVCGYGRIGRRLHARLSALGMRSIVIDPDPELADPPPGLICGSAADGTVLARAGVAEAVGIVAGSDDDIVNLSIIMAARRTRPDLFVIARHNDALNDPLFDALAADLTISPRRVLASRMRALVTTPALSAFVDTFIAGEEAWAAALLERVQITVGIDRVPEVWQLELGPTDAPALAVLQRETDQPLRIRHLTRAQDDRETQLPCHVLMVESGSRRSLDPPLDLELNPGDRLLSCGRANAEAAMRRMLLDPDHLLGAVTGAIPARGAVLRWWRARRT